MADKIVIVRELASMGSVQNLSVATCIGVLAIDTLSKL